MSQLQRVIITDCPHNGRHTGIKGYVVDTFPDGTASVDMGFNTCCITAGYQPVESVKREDLALNDEDLVGEDQETLSIPEPVKPRRGRPPGQKSREKAAEPREVKPLRVHEYQQTEAEKPKSEPSRTNPDTLVPSVVITVIEAGAVSLTYSVGNAKVSVERGSADDLSAILAIIEALTKGGA